MIYTNHFYFNHTKLYPFPTNLRKITIQSQTDYKIIFNLNRDFESKSSINDLIKGVFYYSRGLISR